MKNKLFKFMFLGIILGMLTSCLSIPIGDGKKVKISGKGVSVTSKDGADANIKIDDKDGSFSIKGTDEDGQEIDINVGIEKEMPKEIPKDFPIPKGAAVAMVNRTTLEGVQLITTAFDLSNAKEDMLKYHDLLVDYFNGDDNFELVSEQIGFGVGSVIAVNDEFFFMVSFSLSDEESDHTLSISLRTLDE